jgi:hypothetical protein
MCLQRHSAAPPRRIPRVHINFVEPQSLAHNRDCSPARYETPQENGAVACVHEVPANENCPLKTPGLLRRAYSMLVAYVYR